MRYILETSLTHLLIRDTEHPEFNEKILDENAPDVIEAIRAENIDGELFFGISDLHSLAPLLRELNQ